MATKVKVFSHVLIESSPTEIWPWPHLHPHPWLVCFPILATGEEDPLVARPLYIPISRQDKFVIPDLDLEIVGACEDVCNICSFVPSYSELQPQSPLNASVWPRCGSQCAPQQPTNCCLFPVRNVFLAQQDFDTS